MAKQSKKNAGEKKPNYYLYVLVAVIAVVAGYFIYTSFFSNDIPEYKLSTNKTENYNNPQEPMFKKQGELEFVNSKSKKPVKKIDIEIADNEQKRMQGLMYRRSMNEDNGMLFIFPISEPQSFWMKNTIISLDIMFVNEKKEIIKIHKNTIPYSERSYPSFKNAMYVVEVVAGFSDKYGITEGDKIDYKITNY